MQNNYSLLISVRFTASFESHGADGPVNVPVNTVDRTFSRGETPKIIVYIPRNPCL
jgi:hypothetical protein